MVTHIIITIDHDHEHHDHHHDHDHHHHDEQSSGGIKMILFLAGTSDARELAIEMQTGRISSLSNGCDRIGCEKFTGCRIATQVGRLTAADITSLIIEKGFQAVVDASHPFAEEASKNALQGAKEANVPYIRYERESQTVSRMTN